MRCSQSFLDEIIKFLCSLESSFHVVLKNGLAFYDRTHMTKVMADKSLCTIFLRHPVYIDINNIPCVFLGKLDLLPFHIADGYLEQPNIETSSQLHIFLCIYHPRFKYFLKLITKSV